MGRQTVLTFEHLADSILTLTQERVCYVCLHPWILGILQWVWYQRWRDRMSATTQRDHCWLWRCTYNIVYESSLANWLRWDCWCSMHAQSGDHVPFINWNDERFSFLKTSLVRTYLVNVSTRCSSPPQVEWSQGIGDQGGLEHLVKTLAR